jgi:GT2 family glycosyltransferase
MSDKAVLVSKAQLPSVSGNEARSISAPALAGTSVPRVAIVLGMHRSGTSLLSNIMQYLGCDMADTSDAVSDKNPAGFWERPEIVAVHDEVLAAIDRKIGTAQHLLPFPARWWRRKEVQALKPRLVEIAIRGIAGNSNGMWGFKDPRTCRMLPLWDEVLAGVGAEPIFVHAIRAPVEAGRSMSLKNPKLRPMSDAEGELMWLLYNRDVVHYLADRPHSTIIDYDDWFTNPEIAAEQLTRALGLSGAIPDEEVMEILDELVVGEFRNHKETAPARRLTVARNFYEAMRSDQAGGAYRASQAQLPLIDMMFNSIGPLVDQLRTMPDLSAVAKRVPALESDLEVQSARVIELEAALERAEALRQTSVEQLSAAKRQSADMLTANQARLAATAEQEAQFTDKLRRAREELAATKKNLAVADADRIAARDDLATAKADLAAVKAEVQSREKTLELERARLARELTQAEEDLLRVRSETDRQMSRAATELDDKEKRISVSDAEIADLKAREQAATAHISTMRSRSRSFLAELRRERRRKTNALAELDVAYVRLGTMGAALEQRDQDLAEANLAYERVRVERILTEGANSERAAPIDLSPAGTPEVTAEVHATAEGLAGVIRLTEAPATALIVEARCGTELVATFLAPGEPTGADHHRSGETGLLFPWSVIPAHLGRRPLTLHLVGRETGFAEIEVPDAKVFRVQPEDQRIAEYQAWLSQYDQLSDKDRAAARSLLRSRRDWPSISVIILPSEAGGRDALTSIRSVEIQLYERWEVLVTPDDLPAGKIDPRIRAVPSDDLASMIEQARGDYLCFVESGDLIAEDALLSLVQALPEAPGDYMIYSDEDQFSPFGSGRRNPYFKGDWSLDLFLHQDYAIRLAMVSAAVARQLVSGPPSPISVYQMLARFGLRASPDQIRHVPRLLYSRLASGPFEAGLMAVRDAMRAEHIRATLFKDRDNWRVVHWPLPDPLPRVSLIVPTRDRVNLLRPCISGFLNDTTYPNLEIIIVNNDSTDPETLAYFGSLGGEARVRVIDWSGAFDFSAINNFAVGQATGEIIGLMNNDLKVIGDEWLLEMVRHIVREDVGIVGARLIYADDTLQHAGICTAIGVASHRYKGFPKDFAGHGACLTSTHDVSAVTAACLLIRRSVWEEVGGLDENFPVAYNDVDLSFKVRAAGYRVLYEPRAMLYHLESQSRGLDVDGEKRQRLTDDKERLIAKWPAETTVDPFYNPNLTVKAVDAGLARPPRLSRGWQAADVD